MIIIMNSYHTLLHLRQEQKFSMIYIDAIPRSMSTALEIALTEICDIQINEVFNRGTSDIEISAKVLLQMLERRDLGNSKLAVVSKNIASEIQINDFIDWVNICDLVIFTIRDPLLQTISLIERIGNDFLVQRGANDLSFEDLTRFGPEIDHIFANKYAFKRNSWEHILEHLKLVKTRNDQYVILDGTLLSFFPSIHLAKISSMIGRKFSDSSISNWHKASQKKFFNPNHYDSDLDEQGISRNAWIRKAHSSTKFIQDSRKSVKTQIMQEFFPKIAHYLEKVGYPAYKTLVRDPAFVGVEILALQKNIELMKKKQIHAIDIVNYLITGNEIVARKIIKLDPYLFFILSL